MDDESRKHLKDLLRIHHKNLNELEVQAAQYSKMDMPVLLSNKIKNEQEDIARIEEQLKNNGEQISDIPTQLFRPNNLNKGIIGLFTTGGVILGFVIAFIYLSVQGSNIRVTPIPDENVLRIDTIPLQVSPFWGGSDSQIQGWGSMSLTYDDTGNVNYTLKYSLPPPEQGYTWAGIAWQFLPINFAKYEYIEVALEFSDPQDRCGIKLVDKSDNTVFLVLGGVPPPNSGIIITIDGDR
ncbi:MAG: hypothetical protein HS126_05605 [Anaerolineales bacterium]|nr:hypothetical protein [Anaerolineales bacterium]